MPREGAFAGAAPEVGMRYCGCGRRHASGEGQQHTHASVAHHRLHPVLRTDSLREDGGLKGAQEAALAWPGFWAYPFVYGSTARSPFVYGRGSMGDSFSVFSRGNFKNFCRLGAVVWWGLAWEGIPEGQYGSRRCQSRRRHGELRRACRALGFFGGRDVCRREPPICRMLAADSHSRARWEGLREALAKRYANAAEAYVAMGGRAGGEISLQQLERSLQDLNARVLGLRRGSTAVRSVDVHAILADVERSFQTGINFQQFASALAWEAKGPDVLRSKDMIASRVLVGAPGAALRLSRENEHPAASRGAHTATKRTTTPGPTSPLGTEGARDPRSLLFPEWKGKKWTGSRAPPAHFIQQQKRATALHSGEFICRCVSFLLLRVFLIHPLLLSAVSQDKNAKLLKSLNMSAKMDSIEAAEAKLTKLVQMDEAHKAQQREMEDAAKAAPVQHLIRTPKEPPKMSPPQRHQPPSPTANLHHPRSKSPAEKAEMLQTAGVAMSSKAAELSERLASLNSTVFQQKLSLAETEKNILLKERQEMQAQIRQMNQLQKQQQADMQNKITDQFGKAMKETFEQIKDVMKSIQGNDKKDLVSLNEAFEQRFRQELLYYADHTPQSTLLEQRAKKYGTIDVDLHNFLDSVVSVRSETEGKQGNGFFFNMYDTVEKLSSQMRQCRDHVDAGNLHSDQSPFLLNIINSVQYNPVLSWYTVDSQNFPNAGSVGALARLDPINGQDYVDDFLLELLIAIRLNQIFPVGPEHQSGHSILGSIMPIFFGAERPRDESRTYAAFPREKLHLLSSKPSIETARKAAELLHTVGVSTPENFLRLSVREAVGKILDYPGIWMDKHESKLDAQNEAAKMIIGLARAERAALVAKCVDHDRDPPRALEQGMSFDEPDGDDDESEDEEEDDFTRERKVATLTPYLFSAEQKDMFARLCHLSASTMPGNASVAFAVAVSLRQEPILAFSCRPPSLSSQFW